MPSGALFFSRFLKPPQEKANAPHTKNSRQDNIGNLRHGNTDVYKRQGQNTGLGLAIVKNLVEAMGHRVTASLDGSLFSLCIYWNQA